MTTKTIVAGLLAGLTCFVLGYVCYVLLFGETLQSFAGTAQGVMRADGEEHLWAILLGNLFYGLCLSYILCSWSGINTFMGGIRAGAIFGFLVTLGMDLTWYATSNMMQLEGVFLDVGIFTVITAIASGVIGWWQGRS